MANSGTSMLGKGKFARQARAVLALLLCVLLTACASGGGKSAWQSQYDLGVRYLSEGSYQEAVIAFTAAIEIDPRRPEAYIGRGDAYRACGETAENLAAARADYEAALRLNSLLEPVYTRLADVLEAAGDGALAREILEEGVRTTGSAALRAEADRRAEVSGATDATEDGGISDLFDETYWHWNVSPGNGGNFSALFHADGTFSFVRVTNTYNGVGTYTYDGEILHLDGVDYVWDGQGFSSVEKHFAMGAPDEGWTYTLVPDPDRRYADLMGEPEENGDLMLADFIGMTVGDLMERFGSDLLCLDYWFNGTALGIYYEDLRLPMIFYVLDPDYLGYVRGDEEIVMVEYSPGEQPSDAQAAPGIPARMTYREIQRRGFAGSFYSEAAGDEWLQEMGESSTFMMDVSPELSISFYWFGQADPYTEPASIIQLYKRG